MRNDPALRSDLHTHTTYSDGRTSAADSIRMGRALGLYALAITDHVFDPNAAGWINAMLKDVRSADSGALRVLAGVEGAILDARGRVSVTPDLTAPLDLVLADLGHFTEGIGRDAPDAKHAFMKNVISAYIGASEHSGIDIVAHPFNTGTFRPDLMPADYADSDLRDVAQAFAGAEKRFEIMNQMVWWYPDCDVESFTQAYAELVARFAAEGVRFVLGSDAHSCCGVGNLDWARRVVHLAGVEESLWRITE
jgi:putative hydrolase